MNRYTIKEHNNWVKEVEQLYQKVKLHKEPYDLTFLGSKLSVFPNVFSPKYFLNTEWYGKTLPKIVGNGSLLEIGTGTGAIALEIGKKSTSILTTDINEFAVENAKHNFIQNNLKIQVLKSDVFDGINNNLKFDYIFWNHPYNNAKLETDDILIKAGFDYNYNSLKKYISGANKHLVNPKRGLLLGTGGHADISRIVEIANENNYNLKLLDYIETPLGLGTSEKNDFRIYELIKYEKMNREDLWKIHSNVSDWIKVADSKAVFIVAIVGIVVTLLGSLTNFKVPGLLSSQLSLTFLVASIIFALISISSAILSLYSSINQNIHKSNIFFSDIQKLKNHLEYQSQINQTNLEEDITNQIYIISKIAHNKHSLLQWSVVFIGLSILSIAICFILSII